MLPPLLFGLLLGVIAPRSPIIPTAQPLNTEEVMVVSGDSVFAWYERINDAQLPEGVAYMVLDDEDVKKSRITSTTHLVLVWLASVFIVLAAFTLLKLSRTE